MLYSSDHQLEASGGHIQPVEASSPAIIMNLENVKKKEMRSGI